MNAPGSFHGRKDDPRPLKSLLRPGRGLLLAVSTLLVFGTVAQAQLPQTRLLSVYPLGGKAGSTVELTLTGGSDLDEVDRLLFDHPGISAVPKMNGNQPVANVFVVTIKEDVPPGHHEVRAAGLFGLSNPRTFVVGTRNELIEAEPNNTPDKASPLELEKIVNCKSDSQADVDYFKFAGKQGQRVIATYEAARIDSRFEAVLELFRPDGRRFAHARSGIRRDALLDATLPADGEYLLKVHDATYRGGPEYAYRLLLTSGPHLDYILPPAGVAGTSGKYMLFGRNLPNGLPAGTDVEGRPLEKLEVEIALPADATIQKTMQNLWSVEAGLDGFSYTLSAPSGVSNPLMIQFASSSVVPEQEPNNEPAQAQKITVPGEFSGQFQTKGDIDHWQFEAKSGEVYMVETFGQRSDSSADPYLILHQVTKNEKGEEQIKQITALDDNDTNVAANVFDTRTDDPAYRFQIPADGMYRVVLRDRYFETRGDPTLVYRLAIRKEQPDFRLIAVPHFPAQANDQGATTSVVDLRKGDNRILHVFVIRRDGFNGSVDLTVEGLPPGVTCKGGLIEVGANSSEVVVTAAADAAEWVGHIRVIGKARIGEQDVTREARAGTLVWSGAQNLPAVSRVSRTLGLAVLKEQAPFQVTTEAFRIEVNQGRQLLLPVEVAKRLGFDADVALTLVGLPNKGNIDVQDKPVPKGKNLELVRVFVKNNATLGTYPLYLKSQAQVPYRRNPFAADRAKTEADAATQAATAAAEEAKQAAAVLDAAVKKMTADNEAHKAATTALSASEKTNIDAQAALKGATDAQAAAVTAAQKSVAESEAAARVAATAKQRADELAASAKSATDADKATVQGTAEAAAKVAGIAQKLAEDAAGAAKVAADARTAAEKNFADTTAAAQKAAEALAAAKKTASDAEAALKVSTEAKAKAEPIVKQAEEKSKAVAAAKVDADKKAADLAKVAEPKNLNDIVPSSPIILTVKRAPANLTAAVPGNGALKKGTKLEIKVMVQRVNGYAGPVTLTLPLPPGVAGISAEPVTVAPDKNEAVLTIQAAADATEGDLANMVVRGAMEFEGKAEVDAPIALKVTP